MSRLVVDELFGHSPIVRWILFSHFQFPISTFRKLLCLPNVAIEKEDKKPKVWTCFMHSSQAANSGRLLLNPSI